MSYKELTIFNYKISYYGIRLLTLLWLVACYRTFSRYSARPSGFYAPQLPLQQLIFPAYPPPLLYTCLLIITAAIIIYSCFKPGVVAGIISFLLVAVVNLPVNSYDNYNHSSHLIVLSYFFSIFLLPGKLKTEDYKYVQFYYLGLLITYSLAGLWKFGSIFKIFITNSSDLSWLSLNAAKINTYTNYFYEDATIPHDIIQLYQYPQLWLALTITAIIMQLLAFTGAYNRKILTVVMCFLVTFHFYTKYFVLADFQFVKYAVIILFFPYHYFYQRFFIKKS